MIKNTCEFCAVWLHKEETDLGFCHRYPPTVTTHLLPEPTQKIISGAQQVGLKLGLKPIDTVSRPMTKKDDFCGEFHER